MRIRKQFKFTGQHIVRNCSSNRCKKSIHAHTYTVEVFFEGNKLDNGAMILDFGITKGTIKSIVQMFDNSFSLWRKEDKSMHEFIYNTYKRVIELPVSPSAESYALILLYLFNEVLKNTVFQNNEGDIKVSSVKVHETSTGYAEAFIDDLHLFPYSIDDIYTTGINADVLYSIKDEKKFICDAPVQQIKG